MNAKELECRLKAFAYRVVTVCEALPGNKVSKVIEGQLLRSCFSAAANYRAACRGISKRAFRSKLSIAFEESDESLFWIEVIQEQGLIPSKKLTFILKEAAELASILAAARKTAQQSPKSIQS